MMMNDVPNAAGAVIMCNLEGMILSVSCYGLLTNDAAFDGTHFPALFTERSIEQALEMVLQTSAGKALFAHKLVLKPSISSVTEIAASGFRDGRTLVFLLQAAPETGEAFNRDAEDAFFSDITHLNNELSNAKRALIKKNSQLQLLSEEKDKMIGVVAHDLRNPLGAISGYAQLLLLAEENEDIDKQKLLENIHSVSTFLLAMVENLLDLSSISLGKLQLILERTDFSELMMSTTEMNRTVAAPKQILLKLTMPEEIPPVSLDANKIKQVLNNLIGNAIKFSPRKSTVFVTVEYSGKVISVSVRDQGPGIPEQEQSRLFKAFSTTSVRSTTGEKSTGLGLNICKNIIEAHHGEISFTSQQGKGSVFRFVIPAVAGETDVNKQLHRKVRINPLPLSNED